MPFDFNGGLSGWCYAADRVGDLLFAAEHDRLGVFDISDPTAPVPLGLVQLPFVCITALVAAGSYVYVADAYSGVFIIDVTKPSAPTIAGSYDTSHSAERVALAGSTLLVTDGFYGLRVADASDPFQPVEVAALDTYSHAKGVVVTGTIAYVADYSKALYKIDFSDPTSPVRLWNQPNPWDSAQDLWVHGDEIYVIQSQGGLTRFDDSSGTPVLTGELSTPGHGSDIDIIEVGSVFMIADGTGGLRAVPLCAPAVSLVRGDGNGAGALDISDAF